MSESTYWELKVQLSDQMLEVFDDVQEVASQSFSCGGILAFSLDEPAVDQLMGDRSYSGGNLPEDFSDKIVTQVEESDPGRIFYFYGEGSEGNARAFLEYLESHFVGVDAVLEYKAVEDWNQTWREHYAPIIISDSLEIIPSWMKEDHQTKASYPVYIYPGQGFGTGDHQTTFLCLKILDELILNNKIKKEESCNTLDFGCGSGILGLAVLKMISASNVDFFDIDDEALDNSQENIKLNFDGKIFERLKLISPREEHLIENPGRYKLVFANILADVLLAKRDYLVDSLVGDGYLILSGLLNEQKDLILDAYLCKEQLDLVDVKSKGDWMAIVFRKI